MGSKYPDYISLLLERKYFFCGLLLIMFIITYSIYIGFLCGILLLFIFYIRLNHWDLQNCKLDWITESIIFVSNNFDEPYWGVEIGKNKSKQKIRIDFVYNDRYKWLHKKWDLGSAFYVNFRQDKFPDRNISAVQEFCRINKIRVNKDNSSLHLGRINDENDEIITVKLACEIAKIIFEDDEFWYSLKMQVPFRNISNGTKLVKLMRGIEQLTNEEKEVLPLNPDKMINIRSLGKL